MKQISTLWKKVKSDGKGRDKLLLLVLTGILLLVIVWPIPGNTGSLDEDLSNQTDDSQADGYGNGQAAAADGDFVAAMEQRLTAILENIDGAGEVQVMITVKGSAERIIEKDESYSESRSTQPSAENQTTVSDNVNRSETTVYNGSGGSPYVVKELQPEIEGILVVAQGADNEVVMNEITYAVQVLFDVPVHKIKVAKMSSR